MTVQTITPTKLADYLEAMSHAVFVAGISWAVIDAKWDGMKAAFEGFDPEKVAAYNPNDIDRLMSDPRVVHNRSKIEATIENAGELIVVDREFGGVDRYLDSFGGDNDALVKDLHKRFKFMGDSVAHFFLFAIGYDLPAQEAWAHEHFGENVHHGRRAH